MTEQKRTIINECLVAIRDHGKIEYVERLYSLTIATLRHIALKYMHDVALADELVQDFWADIHKIADGFVFHRNGYAYLCQVMTNRAINKYRKLKKERAYVIFVDYSALHVPAERGETERIDLALTVDQAMKTLDETERIIIQSTYFENKTVRQIAEELRMSKSGVDRLKNEALSKLKDFFTENGGLHK